MALPDEGNASTSLLKLPLKLKPRTSPRLKVVVRAEQPLPSNVVATYRAVVKGSTLYIGPTFTIPHVLETSGAIPTGNYAFDTSVFATYTPGLAGGSTTGGATLDIYLFDGGKPVALDSSNVCPTCSFAMAGGRKAILRVDDLLTAHATPFDSACKLGFGVIVVAGGGSESVNLNGFVVNSHTSAFDLSVFGFAPAPIAAAVESGAAGAVCNTSSTAAKTLTDFARPPAQAFTVTVDATHHHGVGQSNLCVRARTSPAQSGNATISLSGPSGAGTKTVALGADGSATAVFGINQYGSYTGSATVGSTSGSVQYTVDASAGQAFACPGP